jgi:hypothetical protein
VAEPMFDGLRVHVLRDQYAAQVRKSCNRTRWSSLDSVFWAVGLKIPVVEVAMPQGPPLGAVNAGASRAAPARSSARSPGSPTARLEL